MKLFSKLAVVAAAFMMVSVFAGCQNSVDSPDSGTGNKPKPTEPEKTVEVYRAYVNKGDSGDWAYPSALTFYDDNTWDLVYDLTDNYYYGKKVTRLTGTYEGDLPEGEQFFVEIKKEFDESTGKLQDVTEGPDSSISCWIHTNNGNHLDFSKFGGYSPKKVEVIAEFNSVADPDYGAPFEYSLVFYDDNTWKMIVTGDGEEGFTQIGTGETYCIGTYTGNPSEAGSMTITMTAVNEGNGLQNIEPESQGKFNAQVYGDGRLFIDGLGMHTLGKGKVKGKAIAKYDTDNFTALGSDMKAALLFYKDDSFEIVICPKGSASMTCAIGTYEGNPKTSGKITVKVYKGLDFDSKILKNLETLGENTYTINDETLDMDELGTYTRTFPEKEPNVVAQFYVEIEDGHHVVSATYTFYDNSTWKMNVKDNDNQYLFASGTYTGDPTKDGDLQCTILYEVDIGNLESPQTFDATIDDDKLTSKQFGEAMEFSRIS